MDLLAEGNRPSNGQRLPGGSRVSPATARACAMRTMVQWAIAGAEDAGGSTEAGGREKEEVIVI